jgi:hypothetical protein
MEGLKVLLAATFVVLSASATHAITITNCSMAPVTTFNGKTIVNAPGDTVVIQCALNPLPGTDKVEVNAANIVVDGPNGGSVSAHGKNVAVALNATGTITIDDASINAPNTNGDAVIQAVGNITVTAGSNLGAGQGLRVECTGAGCKVDITETQASADEIRVIARDDVIIRPPSIFTANDPRGLIFLKSHDGDVLAGSINANGQGQGTVPCCDQLKKLCATPGSKSCPLPFQLNEDNFMSVCGPCLGQNKFRTGPEGAIVIMAAGKVDLSGSMVQAGTDITITAGTVIDFTSAMVDNCGPKRGKFRATAVTCTVTNASLRDDDPDTAPTLTCAINGVATVIGTCSSQPAP